MLNKIFTFLILLTITITNGQNSTKEPKSLKHYMPLYLDMPAEMNVKKGYKEFDLAIGHADFKDFSGQRALIEYDFAPIDKLGFEIELPFIFVQQKHSNTSTATESHSSEEGGGPKSGNAVRIGFNYSLYSFKEAKTSINAGYFNEIEFSPFEHFGKPLFEANVYNPFVAVAKIFGDRFHAMIYTGTATKQYFELHKSLTSVRFNTILSYHLGNQYKENFIGIESNQTWAKDESGQMTLRPQAQIEISEKWKLGLVASIPVATNNHLNGSGFIRLIYTPN